MIVSLLLVCELELTTGVAGGFPLKSPPLVEAHQATCGCHCFFRLGGVTTHTHSKHQRQYTSRIATLVKNTTAIHHDVFIAVTGSHTPPSLVWGINVGWGRGVACLLCGLAAADLSLPPRECLCVCERRERREDWSLVDYRLPRGNGALNWACSGSADVERHRYYYWQSPTLPRTVCSGNNFIRSVALILRA